MPSTWLGSGKSISHWFDSTMDSNPRSPARETSTLPNRPPRPVELEKVYCIIIACFINVVIAFIVILLVGLFMGSVDTGRFTIKPPTSVY